MIDFDPPSDHKHSFPEAHLERKHISAIWLIPLVAAFIAAYLGWHDYSEHGPLVTVSFRTAQGLIAGQTQVKYKAVTLGTVEDVRLNKDRSAVVVSVRMTGTAKPLLTENARFWMVRPQLNTFNATEIETLVTGSYIQIEPGQAGGKEQRHFVGLENPPAERSDEPGRTFVLKSESLGSINIGSPVYFRGINVGETLGYDVGNGFDPLTIMIFVRAPYDKFVRDRSLFWNASGLSISFGQNGLHLESQSLRAVLVGGVTFSTPHEAENDAPAEPSTVFKLYDDKKTADAAGFQQHLSYITYFQTSVSELTQGSPVLIYGLQVGEVTGVHLLFDAQKNEPKVRVEFAIEPERAFGPQKDAHAMNASQMLSKLVSQGMRVKLETSNLLIGQKVLTMEFAPNAAEATVAMESGVPVLPSIGSSDNMMNALGDVANKLNEIPFTEIGQNLNHLVKSVDDTVGGSEMQNAVHSLATAMTSVANISRKADENLTPALEKLPEISQKLQSAVNHANSLLSSFDGGYGDGSDFQRSTKRVLDEVNDAARSIRLLADFLERHPEALLSGKSYEKDKKP